VQTHFGEWLPTCLQYLDDGEARLYMGDDTLAIFEQQNTLLMIVNESDV